ncbi:MAG: hypothetical protein AAGF73_12755 [Actinomycetota bacterium]
MASIGSAGSIASIGSSGSILSIGSSGSIASIGSTGSLLAIGSAGSVGTIGGENERRLDRSQMRTLIGVCAGAGLVALTVTTVSWLRSG